MGKNTQSPPLNYARIVANKDDSLGETNEISINERAIFVIKKTSPFIEMTTSLQSIASIVGGVTNGTHKNMAGTLTSIVLFLNNLKNYKTSFPEWQYNNLKTKTANTRPMYPI